MEGVDLHRQVSEGELTLSTEDVTTFHNQNVNKMFPDVCSHHGAEPKRHNPADLHFLTHSDLASISTCLSLPELDHMCIASCWT